MTMSRIFTAAACVLVAAAAHAQYCPTQAGTVLRYTENTEIPEHAVKTVTETVDSVYADGGATIVRTTSVHDTAGSLTTEPDTRTIYSYTTAEAPTVVTIMTVDDFRDLIVNSIRSEAEAAGQYVSPQDLESLAAQIRPSGKLQLTLDPNAAEGAKIPNCTMRVSLGLGANMSLGISGGKVLGHEAVTVPAGTFDDCLKISYVFKQAFGSETVKMNATSWYAPGIGLVREEIKDKSGAVVSVQELQSVSRP